MYHLEHVTRTTGFWFALILTASVAQAEVNWPQWGGPAGNNHTAETDLPLEWDEPNVLWKAGLKGRGQSMPVIWGDRLFLTTALDGGRQRVVFCVDRGSGKTLWEQVAWTGEPEKSHRMNGHASATCATNGKVVVAFFGRGGLHAYSLDGQHLWSRDLGRFDGPWGTAASPIFYGDTVIQNCDSESPEAALVAVDYRTGDTVWSTPRPVIRGWSTPTLIKTPAREELVVNGHHGVRGYDPQTGAELWYCKGFTGRGSPVPAYSDGLLYVLNGLQGDVYAVRPGGAGEVTDTHRAWHTTRRAGRDLPSPVVIDNYLLGLSMAGILVCYDTRTGKELWKERVGPKFTTTPLVSAGRALLLSEEGDAIVVEPGEKMKLLAKSKLPGDSDELFRAAPVPCQGQLFVRSDRALYAIGSSQAD